jgi:membrane fusion protein, multidrug efflux system
MKLSRRIRAYAGLLPPALPGAVAALMLLSAQAGCKGNAQPEAPPPPEVAVIQLKPVPVTVYDEYVGVAQSPNTIEIRSQVTGLLESRSFDDGMRVRKGIVLYAIDPRPFRYQVSQAQAALAQAEANLVNAQKNLERNTRLIAQKAVSQQEYDSAVAQARALEAQVEAQRALLRNARLNLEFTTIRAPRDGYMSDSRVEPGALITAQQTLLATLYSSDPMWVSFTISEPKLLELQQRLKRPPGERLDQAPPFHVKLVDGSEYAYPGRLNFVAAAIDENTGTLGVRISLPNPDRVLRPGLFVRVVVPTLTRPDAIRVPQKAVQELQGLKSVYVVTADNKAQQRQITAGHRVGQDWIVDDGLQPGERVVVEGIGKLRPGAVVKPVAVAAEGERTGDGEAGPPPAAAAPPAPASRPKA